MFERVIQDVCDSSQVDFEESGVDQKTLLDLRQVRHKFLQVSAAHLKWRLGGMFWGVGQKRGKPEVVREAVLMGG